MKTIPISNGAVSVFRNLTGADVISPIVMMGEDLAAKIHATKYVRQRKLNRGRVESYKEVMLSGNWNGISAMKVGVIPSGKPIHYDGQHRIEALLLACKTNPDLEIPVTFIVHDVPNESVLADEHFSTTDYSAAARSKGDIDAAAGLTDEFQRSSAEMSALYKAILTIEGGFKEPSNLRQTRDITDKREKLESAREFIEFYYPIAKKVKTDGTIKGSYSLLTKNSAVLTMMYFLWLAADRDTFKAFVLRLCTDPAPNRERFPKGDPINHLMAFLLDVSANRPLGTNTNKWAYVFSTVWNCFVRSNTKGIPKLRVTDAKVAGGIASRKFTGTPASKGLSGYIHICD